ncbi:MAG: hypothetical protein IPN34_18885 [Planctomycetes bacterium]|nr:hypothetical protein [Planctomycetota bacterium]
MSDELLSALARVTVAALAALMMAVPEILGRSSRSAGASALCIALVCGALFSADASLAYALLALVSLLHAFGALRVCRTGAAMLALAALSIGAAAFALYLGHLSAAFGASLLAIALRGGAMPLHVGAAALTERAPLQQVQQLGSCLALVLLHLHYVDHHAAAYDAAPLLVQFGSLATLLAASLALVQRELRGLMRSAMVMHGGLLLAAVGAAGHGHYAAALFAALTLAIAVGGMLVVADALERRDGRRLSLEGLGGRARSYPVLATAFAFFGAAGVAMPGTAGFVGDDLLLHALWEGGAASTAAIILAGALLAIATLRAFAALFCGPQLSSPAPDLLPRERVLLVGLALVLFVLGLFPELVLEPAEALLGS